jgi:hypothetical protein
MQYTDLYDYQREAVDFLLQRPVEMDGLPHRLLALPPGAGKTPITVSAMVKAGVTTALIICPATIKLTWAKQLMAWGNYTWNDIQIINTRTDNVRLDAKVWIVNYELVIEDSIYRALYWGQYQAFICDEAHRLKTFSSKRSKTILGGDNPLAARGWWKWFLTGTPMPNRPIELYTLLKTMAEKLLGKYNTKEKFGLRYCGAVQNDRGGWDFKGASNVDELREMIRPFVHYRTLDQILPDLPEVIESEIFCDVGELEFDETNAPEATARRVVGLAKVPFIVEYVKDQLANTDQKYVVFAYHREVIEQIAQQLGSVCRIVYGGMNGATKQKQLDDFIDNDQVRVVVLQVVSAGEGIDGLQNVCNNIIEAEPDWVPGTRQQTIGRLRRIGQRYPVNVVTIKAINTMDERVIKSSNKKRRTIDRLFSGLGEALRGNDMSIEENLAGLLAQATRIANALEVLAADESAANAANAVVETPATIESAPKSNGKGKGKKAADAAPAESSTPATAAGAGTPVVEVDLDEMKNVAAKTVQLLMKNGKEQAAAVAEVKAILASCGATSFDGLAGEPDLLSKAWSQLKPLHQAAAEAASAANPMAALGL